MSVDLGVCQVESWRAVLSGLHARFAARFARSEPRGRALEYMAGLIAPLERKNGWSSLIYGDPQQNQRPRGALDRQEEQLRQNWKRRGGRWLRHIPSRVLEVAVSELPVDTVEVPDEARVRVGR